MTITSVFCTLFVVLIIRKTKTIYHFRKGCQKSKLNTEYEHSGSYQTIITVPDIKTNQRDDVTDRWRRVPAPLVSHKA